MGLLSSYRVLDLTDERGLLAGRMLADLGADVVQVEPLAGSRARHAAPLSDRHGQPYSYLWATFAANKRGLAVDLGREAGRHVLRQLASQADFFIESLGPGAAASLGLGWPELSEINPALVYATITAFGHDGPKGGYAESDLIVWAAGGPLEPNRDGTRPPLRISVPQAFLNASADAAGGMLLAHHARTRNGLGQLVDVAAQACLGLNTLGRVLADPVGDAHPEWAALISPTARTDQSGSGTGTGPHLKKWKCKDGLVEFHLAIGPAAGPFTNNFFRWMHAEGAGRDARLRWDWRILPELVERGEFTEQDMREVRAATAAFLEAKTKNEIRQAAIGYKLLCIGVSDTEDLAHSPQLAERDFYVTLGSGSRAQTMPGRWATVSIPAFKLRRPAPRLGEHTDEVLAEWLGPGRPGARVAGRPAGDRVNRHDHALPLAGVKVADFSWVVAGPVVGRTLADFGATVVRIESGTRIETARMMQPFYRGEAGPENSALYGDCNAGKYGVTLNLKTEEGRGIARDLVAWADVVAESYAPGQMASWGLDYASIRTVNPSVVMLSTSLMGQTGPSARLAGYGNIGASVSGYQDLVGWPDQLPIGPFGPYTDYVGPRFSLVVLLAALDHRQRTGEGCHIDLAQSEIGVFLLSPQLADYFDRGTVARRRGNRDEQFAPHGVYPCLAEHGRDRFVAIAVCDDAQWPILAAELRRADLAADPGLADAAGRLARAGELDEALAAWTATQRAEDVQARLQARGVPAHLAATSADWAHDPQLAHRSNLRRLPSERFGTAFVQGPRYLLSQTPGQVTRSAPILGQDNEHVLRGLLGYDQARYDRVAASDALT